MKLNNHDNRIHLFVLSPPNSGSTLLTKLLGTSPQVSILPGSVHEGAKLPEYKLLKLENVYNPGTTLPWQTISLILNSYWDQSKNIFVEKSVYNLYHARDIFNTFENCHFIILIRNAYAFCEGNKRRHNPSNSYGQIAKRWINDARIQIRNAQEFPNTCLMTYEELTDNPSHSINRLVSFCPLLESLDSEKSFQIHSIEGNIQRKIINLNQKQITLLKKEDMDEIKEVLEKDRTIVEFFGYLL
jgi:hypothetical protein